MKKELKENVDTINKTSSVKQEVNLILKQIKNNNETKGYSRTKVMKVYAEKVNEIVKEENEKSLI